jgi:hypothetical protein
MGATSSRDAGQQAPEQRAGRPDVAARLLRVEPSLPPKAAAAHADG